MASSTYKEFTSTSFKVLPSGFLDFLNGLCRETEVPLCLTGDGGLPFGQTNSLNFLWSLSRELYYHDPKPPFLFVTTSNK